MLLNLLFTALTFAAPATSDRIEIKDVIGPPEVKVLRVKAQERTAYKGETVALGDEIETQPRQVVHLLGFDGSEWKVAQGTRLKLEKRLVENKNFSYWVFNLVTGAFWGKVTHNENKDGFRLKVKSRNASMGVRGTEYLMLAGEKSAEVDVLDGLVLWGTSDKFEAGSFIEVKAGEHAAMIDGKPTPPEKNKLNQKELLTKYQLSWDEKGIGAEANAPPTIDDCRRQGKGWKATDGKRGECI